MGLFSRKTKTKAMAPLAPEDDADREWRRVEETQDKEHRRRTKRVLKQMRGAAKHMNKLRHQQERRARHQVRVQQRRERRRLMERRRQRRAAMRRQRQQERQQAENGASGAAMMPPPLMKQPRCAACNVRFQALSTWRHHCRQCGRSFCRKCLSTKKRPIPWFQLAKPQHVCVVCDLTVFSGRSVRGAGSPPTAESTAAARPLRPLPKPSASDSASSNPASSGSEASAINMPQTEATPTSNPPPRVKRAKPKPRYSRWLLPLRPFLKRKVSADRLLVEKRPAGPSTEHVMAFAASPP